MKVTLDNDEMTNQFVRENAVKICEDFVDKYIYNTITLEMESGEGRTEEESKTSYIKSEEGTARNYMRGFELITKIFMNITIQEWLMVQKRIQHKRNYHFTKASLVDMEITANIMECIDFINENNINVIGLATNEYSQLQGMINTREIMEFLLNNYKGDIDFFKTKFRKFENKMDRSYFSSNLNLVTAQHNDTLFEVLQKLRDNRVSMIVVNRSYAISNQPVKETMGLVFLTDLMCLLKQHNFHELLTQTVNKFVMNLNGTEEDRKLYKERVNQQMGKNGDPDNTDIISHYNSSVQNTNNDRKMEERDSDSGGGDNEEHDGESFFVFNPTDDPKNKKSKDQQSKIYRLRAGTSTENDPVNRLRTNMIDFKKAHRKESQILNT